MTSNNPWKTLKNKIEVFGLNSISIAIDLIFLTLWVIAQSVAQELIAKRFELSEIDAFVRDCYRIIFAIGSFVPFAVYIFVDVRIIIEHARRQIRDEVEEINK